MAIPVTCQCGKKLKVNDEMAGKRVRCPGCQQIVNVPAATDEEPVAPELIEEDEVAPPPRRKKKRRRKAKSNTLKTVLLVLLGGFTLLFGCCCLGGIGLPWLVSLRDAPARKIIGRWQGDADAIKGHLGKERRPGEFQNIDKHAANWRLEFASDGTIVFADQPNSQWHGQWKVLSSKQNVVSVEAQLNGLAKAITIEITVIDDDHIRYACDGGLAKFGFEWENMIFSKRVK